MQGATWCWWALVLSGRCEWLFGAPVGISWRRETGATFWMLVGAGRQVVPVDVGYCWEAMAFKLSVPAGVVTLCYLRKWHETVGLGWNHTQDREKWPLFFLPFLLFVST